MQYRREKGILEVINYLENTINNGGREAFAANASEGMKERAVDYIALANYRRDNIYESRIESNGAKVVYLSEKKESYLVRFWKFAKYVRKHRDAVWWFHAGAASMYHYVFLARVCGAAKIVYHVHNISYTKPQSKLERLRDRLLNRIFRGIPKISAACSQEAGRVLYGKKDFMVLHNGISIERFCFNSKRREQMRKEWGVEGSFVIGQIGRFAFPKNQLFTLAVIKECREKGIPCTGILVGEGEDSGKIEAYISKHHLQDRIKILPPSAKVEDFYQGFDVMLFPSVYEGLGLVALEAQAAGLPILCSEAIVSEVCITEHIWKLDLSRIDLWVEKIEEIRACETDREGNSKKAAKLCTASGFSIAHTRDELLDVYKRLT